MEFKKHPASVKELIALLKSRRLRFNNEAAAEGFLRHVSYYRLKGYLLHFERKIPNNLHHSLPPGTTFERILEVYELDRKLRLLLFEAIEKIEISFRSNFINVYSLGYKTPHWFLEAAHFIDDIQHGKTYHQRLIDRIKRDVGLDPDNGDARERAVFIEHYFDKYTNPKLPPAWMLAEVLSLGVWSMMYQKLAGTAGAKEVAKNFAVPHTILASWMHVLSVTRNICAHHMRLWNRAFVFKPAVLRGYEFHFANPASIYVQAFAAAYLLRRINPQSDWHLRFKTTALSCPAGEMNALGTPTDWDQNPFWSEQALPTIEPKIIPPKTQSG
jgi:abortive infection bacteriophage resistance protein